MNDGGTHAQRVRSALERYEAPLIRFAASITGNAESAQDVVQDAFLRLCRVNTARLDGHVGAWLYRVCRNRALDVRRKEKRMEAVAPNLTVHRQRDPAPETAAQQHEDSAAVRAAVKTLPDRQREVICLKFENGMTYREIGAALDMPLATVNYTMTKALKALRTELRDRLNAVPSTLRGDHDEA